MEAIRYVVKMRRLDEPWHLVPVGDIHYGALGCDEAKFLETVERIKNGENYLTIGMGDYVENNGITGRNGINKHFDIEAIAKGGKKSLLDEQIRFIKKIWEPLAPKTIGMLIGNHEDRSMSKGDFKERITEPLGVNYLGDAAYIQLLFTYRGRPVRDYIILAQHSRFDTHTHGTTANKASAALQNWEFDLHLYGHTHFALVDKLHRNYLDTIAESPHIASRKAILGSTGSFLKSHVEGVDSYTDKLIGGVHRDIGTITITFDPSKGDIYGHL